MTSEDQVEPSTFSESGRIPTLGDKGGSEDEGADRVEKSAIQCRPLLTESENAVKIRAANELAATFYGVSVDDFQMRRRSQRRLTEARQLGMYLSNVCFSIGYEDIATEINRDRTTVRFGIERVEDRRENPRFDHALIALETLISCLLDKDLSKMIEDGLHVDHDLIAYVPQVRPNSQK